MTYETGDDNRLTTDGAYAYQYDAEGNRTRRYVDEDESGDYSAGDTDVTEYAWDHRNRLTTVTHYASFGDDSDLVVHYTYDAFNQLISRSVDTDGDTGSALTVDSFYFWENGQIVLEFDDDLAYEHGTLNMSDLGHRYLWGPAVDELLADENASTNVITWPLPDHLGTIRDWVNNSGTNLDHVEYDTSGRRIDTAAIDEVFGRAGLFHDKYTGNDYARNRWLDPETGRWLSQDPIGFNGGSFSLYVYAGNATTVATDPSGLEEVDYRYLPQPDRGRWTGKAGDSTFIFKDPNLPNIKYSNGVPDLSAYVYNNGGQCGTVTIKFSSDLSKSDDARRAADVAAAEAKMKQINPNWVKQKDYVWHHQYVNPATGEGQMVLVRKEIHAAASHEGAFSFWGKYLLAKEGKDVQKLSKFRKALKGLGVIGKIAKHAAAPLTLICAASTAINGYAQGERGCPSLS